MLTAQAPEMLNYSTLTSEIIRQTQAREATLPLIEQTRGSRFFFQPDPSDKVCLFFHGFTASPEQFVPLGKTFFNAGYNVLIPLLPGHGIAGDWGRDNPPPLPESQQVYQDFGVYWLQLAQSFGKQVIVGGLSGSGTLAVWLALQYPKQIYRTLAFAPYLSGSNFLVDLIVEKFDFYFKWRTKPGRAHFGYEGFFMPALRVFQDMGSNVLEQAKKTKTAPMLIVSSESDRAVDDSEIETLFENVLKFQPKSWYYLFNQDLHIPHNMMTEAEGNEYLDLLITITKAYVESDLTWAEVKVISDRLQQGYSFKTVIDELHIHQRVSPELAKMLPVVN